nr:hypothetical protein [Tanacetum cinerariifolium]
MKGIKREFTVARTPQQNRVAERKNRTLIEAARTMLADLLLPIPIWAEVVNTACYVQNKVLVTKPHNKTPYELLLGIKENFDAGKVGKETESAQQYVLLPLWSTGSKDPQNTDADVVFDVKETESEVPVSLSSSNKTKKHDDKAKRESKRKIPVDLSIGVQDLRDEFQEFIVNNTNRVNASSAPVTAVRPNSTNNTNNFNVVSPSDNAVSPTFEIDEKSSFVDPSQYRDDPDMPASEDIVYSDDEEDVGVEADFYNLETNIYVSPIPTTRVYKDHPVTQIIGDLTSVPQTRSIARMVKEQGGLNQINDEDFHTCMFTRFLSQEEPKRVQQALKDSSWIKAMQEELFQFKMQKCMSAKRTAWNEFSSSMASAVIYLATGSKFNFLNDLSFHNTKYTSPALTQKVFANMRRISKGFSGIETPLFDTMLVQPQVHDAVEVEEDDDIANVAHLEQDKVAQELEIVKLKQRVKKLEKKRRSKSSSLKRLRKGRIEEDVTTVKEINVVEPEPTVFNDDEVTMTMAQTLIKIKAEKARILDEQMAKREYNHVQTFLKSDRDEEPTKKIAAKETLLQESFKKLRAEVEVSGSEFTQDTLTVDPTDMSEEDVKNMLQIVPMAEFKVKALQVKVGGVTQAYQSFEDMLKDFDREDVDALWRITKEKFSTTLPTVDKEKSLWAELTRLYEPNADDVFRKFQRYMHYLIIWKLHSNCEVHQVSSTTRMYDIYMLAEKDYPLSNGVMTLMLSSKLQVEKDSEVARDLVMKIFLKENQPKSKSLDTSSN